MPSKTQVYASRTRHLVALTLVAWLNLMVQPALVAAQVVPVGMEHCNHAGDCPQMHSVACVAKNQLNIESQRRAAPPRTVSPLVLLPADLLHDARLAHSLRTLRPADTGPPLTIRFCHLRN